MTTRNSVAAVILFVDVNFEDIREKSIHTGRCRFMFSKNLFCFEKVIFWLEPAVFLTTSYYLSREDFLMFFNMASLVIRLRRPLMLQ